MNAKHTLLLIVVVAAVFISGCGRTVGLVPTPVVYQDERIKALWQPQAQTGENTIEIFYTTDRKPFGRHYGNASGNALRVGTSTMYFGDKEMTWEKLVSLSFSDTRKESIPVHLEKINELGTLVSTVDIDQAKKQPAMWDPAGQQAFAEQINATLAASDYKDINIYVHGSIVDFFHPLGVSAGFYHYLGRDGVMIAYAWRTKPGLWNYPGDVKRAKQSVPYLAALIEFLAENTNARRINIISYSAGGPLMGNALIKLREANPDLNSKQLQEKFRIGTVIFASSDIDLQTFSGDMLPRLYDLPKEIIVTLNQNDGTLSLSQFFYGASRLGKPDADELTTEELEDIAAKMEDKLSVINAAEAINQRTGGQQKGHDYWYRNDWVLTEVLAALVWDLPPDQRGLTREEGKPMYHFPTDYPKRIADLIIERNQQKNK